MNYQHNPNQHAQQPEVVVSLAEYRLRKLQDALMNAERSATNEIDQPAQMTVREEPAAESAAFFTNSSMDIDSHRQNVAASYEPAVPHPEQAPAQVVQFPNQVTPPNTFIIPGASEAA